jgi:ferrochelatase
MKSGILMLNLGTPDSPDPRSVGKYLGEFLMDPYVVDIPFFFRWILVHLLIVPRRKIASSLLYKKVWKKEGSPLLVFTELLARSLAALIGENYVVAWGMRYGKPSIEEALKKLSRESLSKVYVVPLYPQYSLAATESSIQKVKELQRKYLSETPFEFMPAFYNEEWYLSALETVIAENYKEKEWDALVFSYHGLPERQVKKTDPTGSHCLAKADCCEKITGANKNCYRFQCFETTRMIAKRLGLSPQKHFTAFQSRLGRTPWIKPYTDLLYQELPKKGIKRIAVVSPSFVADCLETLEEIQIRGRGQFIQNGGEELKLIPCLNGHSAWVKALGSAICRLVDRQ